MGAIGLETDNHALMLLYMRTHTTEDKATLAEDTRGKDFYVTQQVPGYDPLAPDEFGEYASAAPYLRNQTLEYTERKTETLQLSGEHTLPFPDIGKEGFFAILPPEVDWTVAKSFSGLHTPDKRLFGSEWRPATSFGGIVFPGFEEGYYQDKPPVSYLGNLQRIWEDVEEDSDQYFLNGKLPFEQWSGEKGYVKLGVFEDQVRRTYTKESYSNFGDSETGPRLGWNEYWSDVFPSETHLLREAEIDADYDGEQNISAWYYMIDFPLNSFFKVIGGARYETTDLRITIVDPEDEVTWVKPGESGLSKLLPGDGDVDYKQDDILPSLGFEFRPFDSLTLRASYNETVARQTFKELTPIQQSEYLGADVFIGNPQLTMSSVKNYDLRADWTPYPGGLISLSWFRKDVTDPIEYTQGFSDNVGRYVTPVNYPEGQLTGYEVEVRQQLGQFWRPLEGLALGANATFIQSEVTLSAVDKQRLEAAGYPEPTRDMMNAPEHLYNLNLTYDIEKTGTRLGLFYTVKGDTLVAGAAKGSKSDTYIRSVYATEYGTLNFSLSQKIGDHWKLSFKAKNLTDPEIQEVSRSKYFPEDTVKTSYRKGMEFSISASYEF
jgi:outer membrane receptor protein involved in Fe transport